MHPRPEHIKMPDGAGVAALRLRPSSRWGSKRKARRQALSLRVRRARTKGEEGGKKETGCGAEPLPCCFSPATRPAPTRARCWPVPVERGEATASGAWRRLSRGDRVLAPRTPTSRKPDTRVRGNQTLPNRTKGRGDLQKSGEVTESGGGSRPPSPRYCRKPFPSIKLRFIPRKGSSGKRSHPTTLMSWGLLAGR